MIKSNYRYDHGFFWMVLMLIHGNIHGFFGQKNRAEPFSDTVDLVMINKYRLKKSMVISHFANREK